MSGIKSISNSEPLYLSYIYRGNCSDCGSNVETLEQDLTIDGKNHYLVMAYCMSCKKQLQNKEVKKLE